VAAPGRLAAVTGLLPPYDRPLRTDDDVDRRVAALVGRAARDDTLWLLFVDGDDRQAPVVMPVEELSGPPVDELIVGLGDVLSGFLPDLATVAGPGSVVFVRNVSVATTYVRPTVPGRRRSGRCAGRAVSPCAGSTCRPRMRCDVCRDTSAGAGG
jgi:hypothetical protein